MKNLVIFFTPEIIRSPLLDRFYYFRKLIFIVAIFKKTCCGKLTMAEKSVSNINESLNSRGSIYGILKVKKLFSLQKCH